jgi:hypothetical protein
VELLGGFLDSFALGFRLDRSQVRALLAEVIDAPVGHQSFFELRWRNRHFFPVRPDIYFSPALAARHARRKKRHFNLISIIFHTHCRLVAALRIPARNEEPPHPQLADVADCYRRAGRVLRFPCHKVTDLILGRHLADSVEIDDVVEAAGFSADIDDATLGE